MKRKTARQIILQLAILFSSGFMIAKAQTSSVVDTSRFFVNGAKEWQLISSYAAHRGTDSASLELVIEHGNSVNLLTAQLIGKITDSAFFPHRTEIVTFQILNDTYQLRMEPDGSCYLSFVSGHLPDRELLIIPFNIIYRVAT